MRLLESAIYVDDVARSAEFYQRLFGFSKFVQDHRFCALNVGDQQTFLIFLKNGTRVPLTLPDGQVIPPHFGAGNLHFAFGIEKDELAHWEKRLAELGIAIESRVHWTLGGNSIYFRDPDGHLVEIATRGIWPIY